MSGQRVLVSWIGHADLQALSRHLPEAEQRVLAEGISASRVTGVGPLKALLDQEHFDEVHVLSNYGARKNRLAARALEHRVTFHAVELANPTDYTEVYAVVRAVLEEIVGRRRPQECGLCFHLSPGTPTMAAIWLLLGKTRYPATLYQTHADRVIPTQVPFDIMLDVIPEVLRERDAHLAHLAAEAPADVAGFEAIVGNSPALRQAVGIARRAAARDVPVLLTGESGTGKEMFARAMHQASRRAGRPFRAVNCAALPAQLLESELFGTVRGAFTGAVDRPGLLEEADGGTVFLDEVGECDPAVQAKLLRALQPPPESPPCTRVFVRLGGRREQQADVRIIAATNRDLHAAVRAQRFRDDLLYRLAAITIPLPPLRDRRGDIEALAKALLAEINRQFAAYEPGYVEKSLSAGARAFLRRAEWPGNVRQLRNALVQAAVLADDAVLERVVLESAAASGPGAGAVAGVATDAGGAPDRGAAADNVVATDTDAAAGGGELDQPLGAGFDLAAHLEDIQRRYLLRAMTQAGGTKTRAAALLGLKSYQTLDAQLKRLGVTWTGEEQE